MISDLNDKVVIVDENDNVLKITTKLDAHIKPQLHRAISIFIFNSDGEILIQKRAQTKYHAPGLWANACCSHPRPGEDTLSTAQRRLTEELGINIPLAFVRKTIYAAQIGHLFEFELVHIFVGKVENEHNFVPNPIEVSDIEWISVDNLYEILSRQTDTLAPWLRIYLALFGLDYIKSLFEDLR